MGAEGELIWQSYIYYGVPKKGEQRVDSPLAEKLRPALLEEIAGQEHLVGKGGMLARLIEKKKPVSILLWGPPGCGKTTLAKLYAKAFEAKFITFSAVSHGIAEVKKAIAEISSQPLFYKRLIVFVDEIHRFNRAQQDAFLPLIEEGTITLVGATTENPSFALNSALLSRLLVLNLSHLGEEALEKIIARFENKYRKLPLTEEARAALIQMAHGDARHLLNMVEQLTTLNENEPIDLPLLENTIQRKLSLYDKDKEGHYNLISALHKSVRGSDPDASLYWLARILYGGESAQFIARRLIRMAVEDVGLADPNALEVCMHAWNAYDQLGSPEGELSLAEAVVYLALAPKSNALYTAFGKAQELAKTTSHLNPPKTILNAPTPFMQKAGYGKNYQYDHDTPQGFSGQNYFPDEMPRPSLYEPVERGFEREMKKRIEYFSNLREKLETPPHGTRKEAFKAL